MEWVRGDTVGHGSFGTVSLAVPRKQSTSPMMVVKSCGASCSDSLMNEKSVLDELNDCPEIIRCFGDSCTTENGEKLYNLFLEYASGGSLADRLKNSCDQSLPEFEARRYTKAILRGLKYIHGNGYVHCDIKLSNILLGDDNSAKIADFGLAKRAWHSESACELRGTPLYMSPEMVAGGTQDSPADIWALGCVVAEMVTGAPAWRCSDLAGLLMKIGVGEEVPEIPGNISEEGKDFLRNCFVKDPRKRWTAEMLLNHPFIADLHDDYDRDTVRLMGCQETSTSPRCPFDFPDWTSIQSPMSLASPMTSLSSPQFDSPNFSSWSTSPAERIRSLLSDQRPDWSVTDSWINVR